MAATTPSRVAALWRASLHRSGVSPARAQPSAGSAQHWLTPARAQAHEASACSRNIICVSSTLCEFFDHRLGRSRAAREDLAFARKPFCLQSHRGSPGKPVPIPSRCRRAQSNQAPRLRASEHSLFVFKPSSRRCWQPFDDGTVGS